MRFLHFASELRTCIFQWNMVYNRWSCTLVGFTKIFVILLSATFCLCRWNLAESSGQLGKMMEHPRSKSTQPKFATTRVILYNMRKPSKHLKHAQNTRGFLLSGVPDGHRAGLPDDVRAGVLRGRRGGTVRDGQRAGLPAGQFIRRHYIYDHFKWKRSQKDHNVIILSENYKKMVTLMINEHDLVIPSIRWRRRSARRRTRSSATPSTRPSVRPSTRWVSLYLSTWVSPVLLSWMLGCVNFYYSDMRQKAVYESGGDNSYTSL